MADSLPSPPPSPSVNPTETTTSSSTTEPLSERLDALLESYLTLLDTYTTLRIALSRDFSSGFFALTRANNSNALGAGRRYGEEGFDGRMKAARRVRIGAEKEDTKKAESEEAENDSGTGDTSATDNLQPSEKHRSTSDVEAEVDSQTPSRREDVTSVSEPSTPSRQESADASNSVSVYKSPELSTKDPLKWYGILTPPPLRQCQSHFTCAVEDSIPQLLNTIKSMHELESKIWGLRRQLGIGGYDCPEPIAGGSGKGPSKAEEEGESLVSQGATISSGRRKAHTKKVSSISERGSNSIIPSTPALPEPRPRVLKLD